MSTFFVMHTKWCYAGASELNRLCKKTHVYYLCCQVKFFHLNTGPTRELNYYFLYFINLVNDKVVTTKAKKYLRFLRLRIRLWVLATKIDESDKWIGSVKKAFLNVQNCQFCVVTHNHWLNWKTFWNLIHSEFFVTVLYNKTGL